MKARKPALAILVLLLVFALCFAACGGDDDDDDNDTPVDDDDDDNDATPGDDDDDDDVASGRLPTTLDMNFVPLREGDEWVLAVGPGDRRFKRNDLGVLTDGLNTTGSKRLSLAYFMTASDLHVADEESPTRLDLFESHEVLLGAFDSAGRPQYDLSSHTINSLIRTANQLQIDYERDFDFALLLGDNSDSSQFNELQMLVDIFDGGGILTDDGWCRPDTGDLDIDPATGLNRGERDFGFQETDGSGTNVNQYERPDWPNSNADFACDGLQKSSGAPLPWFSAIGNHDAVNMGVFSPLSALSFYDTEDYLGDTSPYGFQPGLATMIKYWVDNPDQKLKLGNGVAGIDMDWRLAFRIFDFIGMLGDYESSIYEPFDLMALMNDTPADPSDDGVPIAADPNRAYMNIDGVMEVLNGAGHGFVDRNEDGEVNSADGGFYRMDMADINGSNMPVRVLVINTAETLLFSEGGVTAPQLAWIELELNQAERDKVLVIIASHHQENETISGGAELEATLLRHPNVIAHVVGHGHDNLITPHLPANGDPFRGYWEIETPSATDFPQQWRAFEIVDNRDGTGSIFATNFDHFNLVGDDADVLADLSRELAFTDAMRDGFSGDSPFAHRGKREDRNVELIFAIPTDVMMRLANIESDTPITSITEFGRGAEMPDKSYARTDEPIDEAGFEAKPRPTNFTGLWLTLVDWAERNDPDVLGNELQELRPLSDNERERLKNLGYLR
jgi:hypothetical protein